MDHLPKSGGTSQAESYDWYVQILSIMCVFVPVVLCGVVYVHTVRGVEVVSYLHTVRALFFSKSGCSNNFILLISLIQFAFTV